MPVVAKVEPNAVILSSSAKAKDSCPKPNPGNLDDLVAAGVLDEHGTLPRRGRGRPSRLYVSTELLGLTGSNPLRG